jgi:predicted deacylase
LSVDTAFPGSYAEARRHFLAAAADAGAAIESERHPLSGPAGDPLALDVARLGDPHARTALVVLSAMHGVEGFAGSAIQTAWLRLKEALPAGLAAILVHAVNPHGFAWLRRVNEDNVDLNRNFLDHTRPHPENPGYEALHGALCPRQLTEATLAAARGAVLAFIHKHGRAAGMMALIGGQYRHADGLYYGGRKLAWSARRLTDRLRQHLAGVARVGLIDIHTGFGPFGQAELMAAAAGGAAGRTLARDWFGDATSIEDGSSQFVMNHGDSGAVLDWAAPDAQRAGICLEFGTRPETEVFLAVQRDNWLHCHGDPAAAVAGPIKAAIRDAFVPDDPAWRRQVLDGGLAVLRRALARLGG